MGPPMKKRKVAASAAPEEITFDESARQDYLTGFHKRKVARTKHAQTIAIKKEKEEKIRDRAQMRATRQQELEAHVKAVNDAVKQFKTARDTGATGWDSDEVEEWNGVTENVPEINREDEYIDEEKYTTVTVESVDVDKNGLRTIGLGESDEEDHKDNKSTTNGRTEGARSAVPAATDKKKKPWQKDGAELKKKKKFRYERGESRKDVQKRAKDKRKQREEKETVRQKGPQRKKKKVK